MASFNVSSTEIPVLILSKTLKSTAAEGAVVCFGTDYDEVALPGAGPVQIGVAGILRQAGVSGDRASILVLGVANVLALATTTVTEGVPVIIANTSGHVKSWTNETNVDVVGISMVTRTIGATAELIPVLMGVYRKS